MILSDGVVSLRPWVKEDAAFMAEAFTDPAVQRYNGIHDRRGQPSPVSLADAEALIDEWAANWRAFNASGRPTGGCVFAIVDAGSGALAGCCGLDDWSKADVAQFGYWLAPGARGRGYATRAVLLMTRWLFELGAARTFLTIASDNQASIAVARRAGFVYEGTMRDHDVWQGQRYDVMWFGALPGEWPLREPSDTS